MDDYISKPVDTQVLHEKLKIHLMKTTPENGAPLSTPESRTKAGTEPLIFDKQSLANRLEDDNLIRVVLDSFVKDAPNQIAQLRKYVSAGDSSKVEMQTHTLKGASRQVEAQALGEAAYRLELLAKTGDLSLAENHIIDIENQFDRLLPALQKEVPGIEIR